MMNKKWSKFDVDFDDDEYRSEHFILYQTFNLPNQ